jgi:multicomponent Na+:H+ antiporter subunit E
MFKLLPRTLLFTLLWWLITEGAGGWTVGVPVIALAVGTSYWLQPQGQLRLRPIGVLRFAAYFLVQSLRGGLDVALRAFRPSLPLAPALVEYRLRLPAGAARVFLADTMSLLPGTLSTELRDDCLCLHVLDVRLPIEADLRQVEARIADLFGMTLRE